MNLCMKINLIERNPPPRGGFPFGRYPIKSLETEEPPSKNLYQVSLRVVPFLQALGRIPAKNKTPSGGVVSYDQHEDRNSQSSTVNSQQSIVNS